MCVCAFAVPKRFFYQFRFQFVEATKTGHIFCLSGEFSDVICFLVCCVRVCPVARLEFRSLLIVPPSCRVNQHVGRSTASDVAAGRMPPLYVARFGMRSDLFDGRRRQGAAFVEDPRLCQH